MPNVTRRVPTSIVGAVGCVGLALIALFLYLAIRYGTGLETGLAFGGGFLGVFVARTHLNLLRWYHSIASSTVGAVQLMLFYVWIGSPAAAVPVDTVGKALGFGASYGTISGVGLALILYAVAAHKPSTLTRNPVYLGRMTDEDHDLIGAYSSLLEGHKSPVARESDLPAPKETIRNVLVKAKDDPIYKLGLSHIETALLTLDSFVPDDEYESAKKVMRKVVELLEQKDEEEFFKLRRNVSVTTNKAINAYMQVILLSKKKQG